MLGVLESTIMAAPCLAASTTTKTNSANRQYLRRLIRWDHTPQATRAVFSARRGKLASGPNQSTGYPRTKQVRPFPQTAVDIEKIVKSLRVGCDEYLWTRTVLVPVVPTTLLAAHFSEAHLLRLRQLSSEEGNLLAPTLEARFQLHQARSQRRRRQLSVRLALDASRQVSALLPGRVECVLGGGGGNLHRSELLLLADHQLAVGGLLILQRLGQPRRLSTLRRKNQWVH